MSSVLAEKKCAACEGDVAPLTGDALRRMQNELDGDWTVIGGDHLQREFGFPDFHAALDFTNRVGEIAEEENHHPDICLGYGKVKVELSTHSIGGLTENDFIVAAKINEIH